MMFWIGYDEWLALRQDVAQIKYLLKSMRQKEITMALDLTKLRNDVAAQTSVISSVTVLIGGLQQMIADLKAAVPDDAATQAALDEIDAALTANSATLAAAVPVNTPAPATVDPIVVVPPVVEPPVEPPVELPVDPASAPQGFYSR